MAAFKIDFHKEIDPWCGHKPKILACDGTHIGVSIKHMDLGNPVTRPDEPDVIVQPVHKRYDRVLIPDKAARGHLNYLCCKQLRKLKMTEVLSNAEEAEKNMHIIREVTSIGQPALTAVIYAFMQKTEPEEVLQTLGRLLFMLSGESAMSSVAPFPSHDLILFCCANLYCVPGC